MQKTHASGLNPMSEKPSAKHWTQRKEIKNKTGINVLLGVMRVFGPRVVKIVVIPVALYYFLVSKETRQVSRGYSRRIETRTAGAQSASAFQVYRHILSFSQSMVDRMYAWRCGLQESSFLSHDFELLNHALSAQSGGAIILVSHLGNFDLAISRSHMTPDKTFNVVMNTKHSQTYNQFREKIFKDEQIRFIDPDDITPLAMVDLSDRIGRGEILVIAADRASSVNNKSTVAVDFLGEDAHFPIGPYVLAHLLDVPVYTLYAIVTRGKVLIDFKLFAQSIKLSRVDRGKALSFYAQNYANNLQQHCLKYPLQWYNFFDFWAKYEDLSKAEQTMNCDQEET